MSRSRATSALIPFSVSLRRHAQAADDMSRRHPSMNWIREVYGGQDDLDPDHLRIDRFAVSGWSFGGLYALACAWANPDRLTAVGFMSSLAPYDRPDSTAGMARFNRIALWMARRLPFGFARQFMKIQVRALRADPEKTARRMQSSVPDSDRAALSDAPAVEMLLPSHALRWCRSIPCGLKGWKQHPSESWMLSMEVLCGTVQRG